MKVSNMLFLSLGALFSCTPPDNYELIEGEWRNVSLHLVQHSLYNGDTDSVLTIQKGEWDSLLQMRPVRTTYRSNGTYVSRYYNLSDSLLFESEGQWHFVGDSLFLSTESGVTAYHFRMMEGDQARFVSRLDWDNDGEPDDIYDGIQQKQRK